MAITLRKSDSAAEVEIGKFLDARFYPSHVTKFVRYTNVETQMLGIDVTFDYAKIENMLVDEKAAAHYVNKNLPTFAFEVNFLTSSNQLVDGWFFDKNKTTQYYLLSWIWATKDKAFLVDDITKLEILIINRQSIINMLAKYGLTQAQVAEISKEIRRKGDFGAYHKTNDKPYYFFYSPQLSEKPINIIIRKDMLSKLALGKHLIINS